MKKGQKKVMSEKNQRELEVGTLLLGNDKNYIIVYKVISYF